MRPPKVLVVLLALIASGCHSKSADSQNGFTANVEIVSLFAGTLDGKLYSKTQHLSVDIGSITDVYDISQQKGWRMFPDSRRYMNIGSKDVIYVRACDGLTAHPAGIPKVADLFDPLFQLPHDQTEMPPPLRSTNCATPTRKGSDLFGDSSRELGILRVRCENADGQDLLWNEIVHLSEGRA